MFASDIGSMFPAAFAGAAAVAFLVFRRTFTKDYLALWMWSWFGLAAFLFLRGVAPLVSSAVSGPLLVLANVAAFVSSALLVLGSLDLARRRPVRLDRRIAIVWGSALLAVLVSLTPAAFIAADALFALAAIVVAVAMWSLRRARGIPAFFVFAFVLVAFAVTKVGVLLSGANRVSADLVLLPLLALAMIIALVEDEREAAVAAASQIEHLAYHDPLTGLPNRALFYDRLMIAVANAERYGHRTAVFFLDIDRFKLINDSLGHSIGDALLRALSRRIREVVRQVDTLSRFGGDEFTLLLSRIDAPEDAYRIARKVLDMVRDPIVIGGRELAVTTSIGISIYPDDGPDPETLVKNADTAMYRAKERGRDNYQLYAQGMNSRMLERLEIENRLRHALELNQLELYYQPVVDVATSHVREFEALLRWNHPDRGVLRPHQFLHVAEASGLILPIGEWALNEAASRAAAWSKRFDRPYVVSVNVSPRQLVSPDLIPMVRRAIETSGVTPSMLALEIAENRAIEHIDAAVDILTRLKSLGVRLALDDFGSGYSSLSYLTQFPINQLKLDASFTGHSDEGSRATVMNAVIAMAHRLDLQVVAEGVENEAQLNNLKALQCDLFQGYFSGAPFPAAEIEQLLEARPHAMSLFSIASH